MFFSSNKNDFMFFRESGARLLKIREYFYHYLQPTAIILYCAALLIAMNKDVLSNELAIESS